MSFSPLNLTLCLLFTLALFLSFRFSFALTKKQFAACEKLNQWILLLIIPFIISLFCLYGIKIDRSIGEERNWMRLATTFAFFRGMNVYGTFDSGAALATLYGPVSFIIYWPSTLMREPLLMLRTAAAVTAFFCLLPILRICLGKTPDEAATKHPLHMAFSLLLFSCAASLPFLVTSLKDTFFNVHADASALCFSALAGSALYFRDKSKNWRSYLLSAFFMILAIWSKQVVIPIAFALFIFVLIQDGKAMALKYLIALTLMGFLVTAIIFYLFDPKELFLNMVHIPSRHPLREINSVGLLAHNILKLLRECLLPIGFMLIALFPVLKSKKFTFSTYVKEKRWVVFALTTLIMIPTTFYIHLKKGASGNTFAYSNYFFLIAAILALKDLHTEKRNLGKMTFPQYAHYAVLGISFILFCIMVPIVYYRILEKPDHLDNAKKAYAFAKKHPHEVYFPRMTLINFLIDAKLYHSVDGIRDRAWAGYPISDELFRAHIPKNLKYIGFAQENHIKLIPLPEFKKEYRDIEGLPEFIIFTKDPL